MTNTIKDRKFFELGNLTKGGWFWSRLGHLISILWAIGIPFWIVMTILDFKLKWYYPDNPPLIIFLIIWIIGGVLAMHACNTFGGLL